MKKLEPSLGLAAVIALSMSAMLGSGLFVLPGLAVVKSGQALWLAYLIAGIAVLPAALSKSELATAMPESGGTYVYLNRSFGPLAGTISGLGLWVSLLLKSSFALVGFGAYLIVMTDLPLKPTALALLAVVVALNLLGVRKVSKTQMFIVALVLLSLSALVLMSLEGLNLEQLQPLIPDDEMQLLAAAGFVFVSYAGVTKVAAVAEEVKDPERNLPWGIMLSLLIVMAFYVVLSAVLVGTLSVEGLRGDLRPIYSLATAIHSKLGIPAALLGVITMTAMALAGVMASSRFPFAMARNSLLPEELKHISDRFRTPSYAILLTGSLMALAIIFLDVSKIAKLASTFKILLFMGVNLTVIVLRESRAQWYRPAYRSPFYPWVQVLGILLEGLLLFMLGWGPALASLLLILAGTALYFGYGRRRSKDRGVLSKMGRRPDLVTRRPTTELKGLLSIKEPPVVVTLLGHERSPETLVEMGAALADGQAVRVAHLTEIPEQTMVEALLEEDTSLRSIRRRLNAMSEAQNIRLEFEPRLSRDIVESLHELANHIGSHWMVKGWAGRPTDLLLQNPWIWLTDNLPCNLALFHDAGVRYIRKILAYVEPGPDDALVVATAIHLAEIYDAELSFSRYLPEKEGATALQSHADYLDQIHHLAKRPNRTRIIRGQSFVEAMTRATAAYDLLVMGSPQESFLRRLFGSSKDRLTEKAACSVLRLQTPRQEIHQALQPQDEAPCRLQQFMDLQFLDLRLEISRKEALFQRFAQSFAEGLPECSQASIYAALWERERTQNTAVGMGVALPHATLDNAKKIWLGIFTTQAPIPYQALDEQPVDVFFVTLGPPSERHTHLKLLARLSRTVLETDLLERLRGANSQEEMMEIVSNCAGTVEEPPS